MSDKTKKSIVARHKKVAFYGVPSSDGMEKFLRMPKFTQLSQSKIRSNTIVSTLMNLFRKRTLQAIRRRFPTLSIFIETVKFRKIL